MTAATTAHTFGEVVNDGAQRVDDLMDVTMVCSSATETQTDPVLNRRPIRYRLAVFDFWSR